MHYLDSRFRVRIRFGLELDLDLALDVILFKLPDVVASDKVKVTGCKREIESNKMKVMSYTVINSIREYYLS